MKSGQKASYNLRHPQSVLRGFEHEQLKASDGQKVANQLH